MIEQVELTIRQPGHPDRVVRLPEGPTRLGRAEDNDVVLSDVGVSRRHARVVVTADKVRVEDLGSGNGTYYRGFRIQSQVLESGDEVVIDPFILTLRIKGDLPAPRVEPVDASDAPAVLEVVVGTGLARSSYPMGPQGLTIGRSENRDVVVPDPAASRHHCTILPRDGEFVLRDMGSANGVFVNSVRVRESLLASGDRVRIGNTEFRFVVNDAGLFESTASRDLGVRPGVAPPPRRPSRLPRIVGALVGLLAVVGLVALVAALAVVIGILAVYPTGPQRPELEPTPPDWVLQLPGGLPQATITELFEQGIAAMRERENRDALEAFYRALTADPGNTTAERLAFVAGEFVVLDAIEPQLREDASARLTREARRDSLLEEAPKRTARGRRAQATLEEEYREDPLVIEAMGWEPGPETVAAKARIDEAAALEAEEDWAAAAAVYDEVLAVTRDPSLRKTATARQRIAQRELAREVAVDWRAGIEHESWGRLDEARSHYQRVLEVDPGNVSIRLRLERLDARGP